MTTTNTEAGTHGQTPKSEGSAAPTVEKPADTAALITEEQVLFGSAAALASAPARHRNVAHQFASVVRAMFTRPERPRAINHYPQRFGYLEQSAMSREMDRL